MSHQSQSKLIFVVGVWRSGTSLLYSMLNQHPQIALMFEAEPFGLFPLDGDQVWPDNWAQRLEFYNQAISRHQLDVKKLPKRITGREVLLTMFRVWAARKKAAVIGGKSPIYHKWLPDIARIFPEAEFIIIWRDPLACCRSVVRASAHNRFFAQRGMLTRTLFGTKRLARGVERIKRAGHRVHEITYENLLSSPEMELKQICGFLSVEFDPVMLDLQTADYSMLPPGEHMERVRAGEMVKNSRREEILPESLVAKGRRYEALWRERFAHLKLAKALRAASGQSQPDEAERIRDWLAITFWKNVGNTKRFMFRTIPLNFWIWLRHHNPRRRRDPASAHSAPAPGKPLTFSIITPSFRNSDWLKLCIASVADQQGIKLEHIVQDSCSDDGTQDWLPHDARVKAFIEKDQGMYDAVNRGYRRATGDILAYLNCDEQYLPGALKTVQEFFASQPEVEVLLAGSIVTDGEGQYLCHRHSLKPHLWHMGFRFPVLTSSIFIRRKVIHERGLFFDTKWRDLGDFHWVLALMKHRVPMAVSNAFTSVFADTGENMNLKPNARREKKETDAMTPQWIQWLKPVWVVHHRLRRLLAGHFFLKPTEYSLYTRRSLAKRVTIDVPKPTAVWWNRL